jgi:hypothetical protein
MFFVSRRAAKRQPTIKKTCYALPFVTGFLLVAQEANHGAPKVDFFLRNPPALSPSLAGFPFNGKPCCRFCQNIQRFSLKIIFWL